MTIKQLIEELSAMENQDALVVVRGYEGGYDEVTPTNPELVDIALNVHSEWYYGKHERVSEIYQEDRRNYQIVKAIIF